MNVAIIGCGHAGYKHVRAYQEIEGIREILIYDKRRITIPGGTTWKNTFSDIYYKKNNVEIASICTPSNIRFDVIDSLIDSGIHLLIEKPLALSIDMAEAIIRDCKEYDVILGVVMQKRFSPAIQQLRGEILAGVLGKPLVANMSVRWCRPTAYYKGWKGEADKGGSILINQCLHHIDILQWILGPVTSVFGYVETIGHKINTSDAVVATLKFESGSLAVLEASTVAYPKNIGETLTILSEWGHHTIDTAFPNHEPIIRNFVECVREKREPMGTGEEALKSLKIALAIQESSDTGKEIFL